MCLSTLYEIKGGERKKLGDYISNVISRDGVYVFTDVMGEEISVKGKIRSLDLVKNEITIEVEQQAG